jgi:acetyl esterase/lipase
MPLQDALRAVRLVRSRAAEWKLDAGKIGLMGFSAGGHVAATAGTLFDEGSPTATDPVERLSSRADFLALIYPQISMQPDLGRKDDKLLGPNPSAELRRKYSPELQITPRTPPSFLVLCGDDPYLNP